MNWKTLLGALGICTLIGGWMVTASVTAENRSDIKDTQKEVQSLHDMVIEQRTMNSQQTAINGQLTQILAELKKTR
jgi:hypothetical protein